MAMRKCGFCSVEKSESTKISSCVCNKTGYCSLECAKKDWKTHKRDCPAYIRVLMEGKRYGLVSTRKIKSGQEVGMCREVIVVPSALNHPQTVSRIMEEFDILSEEDKEMVLSLNDKGEEYGQEFNPLNKCAGSVLQNLYSRFGGKQKVRKVVRIYWQNRSGYDGGGKMRLYFTQVLMNHSCAPNASVSFDKKGQLIILAMKNIEKGEEIVESYFHSDNEFEQQMGEREERIQVLKKHGFTCCCKICSLTGEDLLENDQIRQSIKSGYANLEDVKNLVDQGIKLNSDYLEAAEDLMVLLNKIPEELLDVQKEILVACYTVSIQAVMEGTVPRVEPKKYKSQLYQVIKGFGHEMEKLTNEMIQEAQMALQEMGGAKYLHMF